MHSVLRLRKIFRKNDLTPLSTENTPVSRLEILSIELTEKLRQATVTEQRAVGQAAVDFAVSRVKVEDSIVSESLVTLRTGNSLSPEKKAQLESTIARLDQEYFDLQQAVEEGQAFEVEYLRVFGQARAVAALLCAFKDDPFEAATEAVYEAAAITDEPYLLFTAVERVLR
jgi:hypothetical protein